MFIAQHITFAVGVGKLHKWHTSTSVNVWSIVLGDIHLLKLASPYSPVAVILAAITLVLKHCTVLLPSIKAHITAMLIGYVNRGWWRANTAGSLLNNALSVYMRTNRNKHHTVRQINKCEGIARRLGLQFREVLYYPHVPI